MKLMLIRVVYLATSIYSFGLIAYVVLTWVNHPQAMQARSWLGNYYKPVLEQIKRVIKPIKMGNVALDLSPIILFFAVGFIGKLIMVFLIEMP